MGLFLRLPRAGRLVVVGVLALVAIVGVGVVSYRFGPPLLPLPLEDSLTTDRGTLRAWDSAESRGRYRDRGFEIAVKRPDVAATAFPNTWNDWDIVTEVTVEFAPATQDRGSGDPMPSVGVLCEGTQTFYGSYAFRVGIDGRYAIFRHQGSEATLLASNYTLGAPRLTSSGPVRIKAECIRRSPTTLRLSVDGRLLISVRDTDARGWGRAGLLVVSADAGGFNAVFRDLRIRGN
jgi:hypothetical protein